MAEDVRDRAARRCILACLHRTQSLYAMDAHMLRQRKDMADPHYLGLYYILVLGKVAGAALKSDHLTTQAAGIAMMMMMMI